MSHKYLLDASALLALLQDERGSEIVAQHILSSAISTVNLAEVASVLNKIGMPENVVMRFLMRWIWIFCLMTKVLQLRQVGSEI